jgi:hypothetical protein
MENKQSNISVDPETGKVDYGSYYNLTKIFREFLIYYKDVFLKRDDVVDKNDPKFYEIFDNTKKQYNQFISNLKRNHPKEFRDIEPIIKKQIREFIQTKLKEMSATGAGASAGHFEPGININYAAPVAFNPNKKAKSTQNEYYYKLKDFKPVNAKALHAKVKGIEHKDLRKENVEKETWINFIDNPKLKEKVKQEIKYYDEIESKLNTLLPLLKKVKTQTIKTFQEDPQSAYSPEYGADMAVEYLNDIITLFSKESRIK